MLRYVKIVFVEDVLGFVSYAFRCFGNQKGVSGPYLVNIFEVPKMFQKVSECVRGPSLAILE